ncbi:hypothetical protein STEG23_026714 [Scotinomys teguina]
MTRSDIREIHTLIHKKVESLTAGREFRILDTPSLQKGSQQEGAVSSADTQCKSDQCQSSKYLKISVTSAFSKATHLYVLQFSLRKTQPSYDRDLRMTQPSYDRDLRMTQPREGCMDQSYGIDLIQVSFVSTERLKIPGAILQEL